MITDLSSQPQRQMQTNGGQKVLALICVYLVMAVAVGVTHGAPRDLGNTHAVAVR